MRAIPSFSAKSGCGSIWLRAARYWMLCQATHLAAIISTLIARLDSYRLYNLAHCGPRVGWIWREVHLHQVNRLNKCLLFTVLCLLAEVGFGEPQAPGLSLQAQVVQQQFAPLFEEVSVQLSTDKQRYLSDPVAYNDFLDRTLRPLWDMSSTARALVGRHHFSAMTPSQQQDLVSAVRETLARYAFEGLEKYSGQQFRIVDVVINQRANMGWVQVLMESKLIPDIVLDVLIKQTDPEKGTWQAVDIRVKGITYVSVKKHSFREIIEEQGIEALITNLERKNREYFADICTKTQSSGRAPCALSAE